MSKYDIFLSYRRDGGEQSAKAIYDKLNELGYHVFLDVETLRSGAFNTKLYSVIEECSDVLVILSPNSLDRCDSREDWVRLEIAHALRCKKNVIPIMLRGFEFPESLPEDIEALRNQNGLQSSIEFFDAFIKKLTSFLVSKSTLPQRIRASMSYKRAIVAVLACALITFGIWGSTQLVKQHGGESSEYPVTNAQKNAVSSLLYCVQLNLTTIDSMLSSMEHAVDACDNYLKDTQNSSYDLLVAELSHSKDALNKSAAQAMAMPADLKNSLADTSVSVADAEALSNYPSTLLVQYNDTLDSLLFITNPQNPLELSMRTSLIETQRKLLGYDADLVFLGLCELVEPIKESSLKKLREDFLPSLQVISTRLPLWSKDPTAIKSQTEQVFSQQNLQLNEFSMVLGDMNKDFLSEKEALKKLLIAQGYSQADADTVVNDSSGQASGNSSKDVDAMKKELAELQQTMRDKYAPKEEDNPYLVWGKALRFLSAGMKEDAIQAFEFFLNKMKSEDENAASYVASAVQFVSDIDSTGIDYGVLVVGYEPGKPQHDVLRIGDIIVAVNDVPVKTFEQFEKERNGVQGEYEVSVLRPGANEHLAVEKLTIPINQPKLAFMDLSEEE